jgi:hypothetical protein
MCGRLNFPGGARVQKSDFAATGIGLSFPLTGSSADSAQDSSVGKAFPLR